MDGGSELERGWSGGGLAAGAKLVEQSLAPRRLAALFCGMDVASREIAGMVSIFGLLKWGIN